MAEQLQLNETAPAVFEGVARHEIDLEDGSGKQVYEARATGGSQLEADLNAHKAATAKSLEAHKELIRHKRKVEAENREFRAKAPVEAFVSAHPDYQNEGAAGEKNGELMRMKLHELGLPVNESNLHQVYAHLKQKGFLDLKGEAEPEPEPRQIEPAAAAVPAAPTPQRTKKASGISTQSRPAAAPASPEPSEHDLYTMPMEKLKLLANKQTGARGW